MTPESRPSPDAFPLLERADALRRAALQTRLRLAEQREALERLTRGLAAARATASAPAPRPVPLAARAAVTLPRRLASVPKEAVAVSAPVPASLGAEARRQAANILFAALPFAAIGAVALLAHARMSVRPAAFAAPAPVAPAFAPARDALARVAPPPPALDDDRTAEALQLVHEWRPEGEERTLLQRLGGELDRPGQPPAWTVERTGPRDYLVRFRDGSVEHAFEADLEAGVVRPLSDESGLLAHR